MNFSLDKEYFKSIMNFAGWNLIGNLAYVVKSQGINILINIFAARLSMRQEVLDFK